MSEQGRTTLTSFGKSNKSITKLPCTTFRFDCMLSDPNEDSCPVFDYGSLVKSKERKIIKKRQEAKKRLHESGKTPNGAFGDEDEEAVKGLVQKLEEKYGRKGKSKSYAELGAGYDENDPFIDNTEACDEELREDQETPRGGYYINSGPLELKRVEASDHSDAEDIGKRKHKRVLQVIEEDEENTVNEDEVEANEAKEDKAVICNTKSTSDVGFFKSKEPESLNENEEVEGKTVASSENIELNIKRKKKRIISDEEDAGFVKLKKAKTVKALLEEKRTTTELTPLEEPKKHVASINTSISEAIESVVNAGNNDENSNSSSAPHSGCSSTSDDSQSEKPVFQVVPPPLPENLSSDILNLVDQIKQTASVTENTRKTFCRDINDCLIKLEWKSKDFSTPNRNMLFAHLACHLPCTKDTLMRRAKKLFIGKEESQIEFLICKLKATIDATMPSLLEKYENERIIVAEEGNTSSVTTPIENSTVKENQQVTDTTAVKSPKRKFPWTVETREYLREIVRLKNRCYKVLKPRKNSNEDFVRGFLQSRIWILWPPGWMKISVLLRESSRSPIGGKFKHSSRNGGSSKSDSSRLSVSTSHPSSATNSISQNSICGSSSVNISHQPLPSPLAVSTPLAVKSGDSINFTPKTKSILDRPVPQAAQSQSMSSVSPNHLPTYKTDRPEMFSMDCLLKRTNESANCSDYHTTLSDLMKQDSSVIMNGASLAAKNVNSNKISNSGKSDSMLLDLTSVHNGTPSVIQSVANNERTVMRGSDSVSLSVSTSPSNKNHVYSTSSCKKEASQISVFPNVQLNRKQRLLQQNTQPNWFSQSNCDIEVNVKTDNDVELPHSTFKSKENRMHEETTTATDFLSQIINESLLAPSQPPSTTPMPSPFNAKEDGNNSMSSKRKQEILFDDVMKDIVELNHMSSRGSIDNKQDSKNNSFAPASWSHSSHLSQNHMNSMSPSQFQSQYLKHLNSQYEAGLPSTPTSTPSYPRHNVSSYENSPYMNEINKSAYNSSSPRSLQGLTTHAEASANQMSQMNPSSRIKPLTNTGIVTGHPHSYMPQMEYGHEDRMMGLNPSLPYGLAGWPYPGSESQSHQ